VSVRSSGVAALLWTAALLGGCTKEEPVPGEDRTLEKLRAEVDRVNRGGAPANPPLAVDDPRARLASRAAGHEEKAAPQLSLPGRNDTVHVGTVAVKLTGLEAHHSVRGNGAVGLTTDELFLRVELLTQNVGSAPVALALGGARLRDAWGKEYTLARDAQLLTGTRPLERTWEPDKREPLVLLFELPPAALASGLTLLLPAGSGEDARIPLQ
jgi:hypothetical protein